MQRGGTFMPLLARPIIALHLLMRSSDAKDFHQLTTCGALTHKFSFACLPFLLPSVSLLQWCDDIHEHVIIIGKFSLSEKGKFSIFETCMRTFCCVREGNWICNVASRFDIHLLVFFFRVFWMENATSIGSDGDSHLWLGRRGERDPPRCCCFHANKGWQLTTYHWRRKRTLTTSLSKGCVGLSLDEHFVVCFPLSIDDEIRSKFSSHHEF